MAMTTQTQVLILMAICGPQQLARIGHANRIIATLTQRFCFPRLLRGRPAVSALERQPRDLGARSPGHPGEGVRVSRRLKIVDRVGAPLRRPCRPAFVAPELLLSGDPRPRLLRQVGETGAKDGIRLGGPPSPQ